MNKKITAALVCAIMVLSLTGCGENEGDPESSNGESSYSASVNSLADSKPTESNTESKPTESEPTESSTESEPTESSTESKPQEQPKPVTNKTDWSKVPIVEEKDLVYTIYEAGDISYGKYNAQTSEEMKEVCKNGVVLITEYLGSAEYINLPDKVGGKNCIFVSTDVNWGDNAKAIRFSEGFSSPSVSRFISGATNIRRGVGKAANVTEVVIPDNWISVGGFSGMPKLRSIDIPKGIRRILGTSFEGCTSLKSVTIPETVDRILSKAFSDCTALETVSFPKKISGECDIYYSAFESCTSLKSIEIPEGVVRLGIDGTTGSKNGNVFAGCTSLAKVSLPSTLKEIYKGTFSGCTSLKSIDIPDNVTKIETGAFEGCTGISINYKGKTYTEKNVEKLYDKDLSTM